MTPSSRQRRMTESLASLKFAVSWSSLRHFNCMMSFLHETAKPRFTLKSSRTSFWRFVSFSRHWWKQAFRTLKLNYHKNNIHHGWDSRDITNHTWCGKTGVTCTQQIIHHVGGLKWLVYNNKSHTIGRLMRHVYNN